MTGMDDLITWLRAQLDEDERVARACPHDRWRVVIPPANIAPPTLVANPGGTSHPHLAEAIRVHDPDGAALQHAARWDPARVLAEVDAKRRILDLHRPMDDAGDPIVGCHTCSWRDDWETLHVEYPCPTLRLLAPPRADRPGYPG